eukprot:Nitzschia sp. Nitz4//scaffold141_size107518//6779//7313//NITZ4_004262-RA/size107518-exonerate_est2genome-gene-0.48-mRNA-1//1//CDS//3329536246//3860//frame0
MVKELDYRVISLVVDTWEVIRRINDYKEVTGVELFKRFFQKEPEAMGVFGLEGESVDEHLFTDIRLRRQAAHWMHMFDRAVNLLGPDVELLTTILKELAVSHVRLGVKPEFYAPMGDALLDTLEKFLGDYFTPTVRSAWAQTYEMLMTDMIRYGK